MEQSRRYLLSLALLTVGFLWLWTFNRNPHILLKYFSHQGYIFTWVYFLLAYLGRTSLFGYQRRYLF